MTRAARGRGFFGSMIFVSPSSRRRTASPPHGSKKSDISSFRRTQFLSSWLRRLSKSPYFSHSHIPATPNRPKPSTDAYVPRYVHPCGAYFCRSFSFFAADDEDSDGGALPVRCVDFL